MRYAPFLASLLSAACYEPSLAVDAVQGSKHPACAQALPTDLPDDAQLSHDYNVPEVCADEDAAAEVIGCSDDPTLGCATDVTCARVDSEQSGYCLRSEQGRNSVALTYRAGACFVRVSRKLKAALCCEGVGVDCRQFPLSRADLRSGPGELCTKRAECEPGLVCAAIDVKGSAARCICPGTDGTRLVNEPICGS